MISTNNIIDISFAKVWLDKDDICHVVIMPNVVVGLTEMKESLAAQKSLFKNRKMPALVDMREIKNSTREARDFSASEEYAKVVSAVAILESTVVGKILGNLFINFSKPPYPTKLFTSESAAIDWLQGYVHKSTLVKPKSAGEGNGTG